MAFPTLLFHLLLLTSTFSPLSTASPTQLNPSAYPPSSTITRDICIIGGGSTGTYSAIRLSDSGQTVVVIEANDRLGGHTNTYIDPSTNETVDYGVSVFHNLTIVQKYFARFDIPLVKATLFAPGQVTEYVDFRTGKIVAGYALPDPSAALAAYGAQLEKYAYVEAGFDLPDPVPADLLLPFGEFVTKYNLEAAMGFIFGFAQGLGNLLEQYTLYVFKNFGLGILQDLQSGFLTTARQDNSEIYVKALAELGPDKVLLQSHVIATDRSSDDGRVKVLVQTPQGKRLIVAKKLLITIPPQLNNLQGFDLSANESSLFAQFLNSAYYTALLRNTKIPPNTFLTNTGSNTTYNIPVLPGLYSISPSRVPGLYDVKVGSASALSDAQVQALIVESILRLGTAGTLNDTTTTTPVFAAYASHTPFELTVSKEAIQAGFYRDLYALQGQRHTWYTGAAFHTHDSSLLWQFTEGLIPGILA